MRDVALSQEWLAFAHAAIRAAPDWALLVGVPAAVVVVALPTAIGVKSSWEAIVWVAKLLGAFGKKMISIVARSEIDDAFRRGIDEGAKRTRASIAQQRIHELALNNQLEPDELKAHKRQEFALAGYVIRAEVAA